MPTTGSPLGTALGMGIPVSASEPARDTALSRYLDPNNGTYLIDSTSGVYGTMPETRQRVMLALVTARGSSTVLPDFGLAMPRKLGKDSVAQINDSVRRALDHMRNDIALERVDVNRTIPGRVEIVVSFTDKSTGQRDQVTI